jgi:hypothetical protein
LRSLIPGRLSRFANAFGPKGHLIPALIQPGQTEAARVAAAREVLDRGYGRPAGSGTQVKVNAASGQQLNIVCSEEERQRLIAQRERLLAEREANAHPQAPEEEPNK